MKKHSRTVACINRDRLTKYLIRDYFQLSTKTTLMASLLDRGLGQADLVLCLLHLRDRARGDHYRVLTHYIHRVVGKPILVGPPCLLRYHINGHAPRVARAVTGDRKILWVTPANPRQTGTQAHLRWSEFRIGRTISQLRKRGVTKRVLRKAERKGWIRYEEIA